MLARSLGHLFATAAAEFGDKSALITTARTMTFTELDAQSNQLANGLAELGIQVGDRVSLYAPNSWEWVVSYFAVLKMGGVINPLNMMLTGEEVVTMTKDCGAVAIIAASEKAQNLTGLQQNLSARRLIAFGNNIPEGFIEFGGLMDGNDETFPLVDVDVHDLASIVYTSGTTGHPKGAMLSHYNILLNTAMSATMHNRNDRDTVVSALPCSHVYGNIVMNAAFAYGMTLVLHQSFAERDILESIQSHKATMFEGVPTMFMYLLNFPDLTSYDLSSLTRCTVGGQTMPVAKMEQVIAKFGCPLIELWGMTEIGGLGATHTVYGPGKLGSIGVAMPHTRVRIGDTADAAKTMPVGEPGELMVQGGIVMGGYYGNESATNDTISADGWLRTGDIAHMDEDGFVFIVDRLKDLIITAGYNVYPAEIERVVAQHPGVAMVAVGSVPDEDKGELAKAYIISAENTQATPEEIISFCREKLAAYKVPRFVQFVEDFPKTSSGKILRRKLSELDD